jgi:hypothetical protein
MMPMADTGRRSAEKVRELPPCDQRFASVPGDVQSPVLSCWCRVSGVGKAKGYFIIRVGVLLRPRALWPTDSRGLPGAR